MAQLIEEQHPHYTFGHAELVRALMIEDNNNDNKVQSSTYQRTTPCTLTIREDNASKVQMLNIRRPLWEMLIVAVL